MLTLVEVTPLPSLTRLAPTTSYGATEKANMAATSSIAAVYDASTGPKPTLILGPEVRCPCCADIVQHFPAARTIEPCLRCRRPLTFMRMVRRPRHYQLRNVIDLADSRYGIVTMLLVMTFVLSEMNPSTFAKAVTVLMFVIGSLLPVNGTLSVRTAIDRTWMPNRHGVAARIVRLGKTVAGGMAIALLMIGLHL